MEERKIEATGGEIIIFQTPDGLDRLDVKLQDETVWLTQAQMAILFQKDRTVIGRHIRNVYKEGGLSENITRAKSAHMGMDGDQIYYTTYYNLDVIISVGYRVKSLRGTQFRQWANGVLKEYLLRGYVVNHRLNDIDRRMTRTEMQVEQLNERMDFYIQSSLPRQQGIFFEGQVFDAYEFVAGLIERAETRIVLVDNYVDAHVLLLLGKRGNGVSATIYTANISAQLQADIEKYNNQYVPVEVRLFRQSHDRFLCIDDEVYLIGASIKDLGKKWFGFSRLYDTTPDQLLARIHNT